MKYSYLVHHFLEDSTERLPDKIALICGAKRLTYREINETADSLALSLIDMGVERQDRVIIFLDSSPGSVISLFGIMKAGAIFVMLNPTMKVKKLNYILRDSGAKVLITQAAKARIVMDAVADAPDLNHVIWTDKLPQMATRRSLKISHHLWNDTLRLAPFALGRDPRASRLKPNAWPIIDLDLAAIIYTSGSTGDPKGVMSAHWNVVAAARSISQYLENVEDDIVLNVLPLSFDYGLYQVFMTFLFGGTLVLERSFLYTYKVIEKLVQEKATGFPIVPTMVAILLQMEDLSKFDFSSLRYMTNTAAALPVSYIHKLRELFPHVTLYSMYGLTECKRVSYLPPEQLDKRPDSVGIPIPNEETFVVDEMGREVPPGHVGELVVRGSNVMQGYWNAPEDTALAYRPGARDGERLLYTGDLFKRDEEGFLYFVARKDDMIKTRGERVSPKEIEETLCELKGVAEAAVIGVPDEILGQAVKAFVVASKGRNLNEDMVLKHCAQNLEPFMVPKYVEFTDSFPKSSSGKIDKKELG
jgi:amino acid adenylation domain-containing protein